MGEIADDIINGACCQYCNAYFKEEHGFPVVCDECWKELAEYEKPGYELATNDYMEV